MKEDLEDATSIQPCATSKCPSYFRLLSFCIKEIVFNLSKFICGYLSNKLGMGPHSYQQILMIIVGLPQNINIQSWRVLTPYFIQKRNVYGVRHD